MASIRQTAQDVIYEARDGIAWIALYKEGRGWGAQCFWAEFDETTGTYDFDDEDAAEQLRAILAIDENAIFVNPYYNNLGPTGEEGMTRDTLAKALRWQYDLSYYRLDEVREDASVKSEADSSAESGSSSSASNPVKDETGAARMGRFSRYNPPSRPVSLCGMNSAAVHQPVAGTPLWDIRQRPPPGVGNIRQERSA